MNDNSENYFDVELDEACDYADFISNVNKQKKTFVEGKEYELS